MKSADGTGIICDLCAIKCIKEFTYYSFDFAMIVRQQDVLLSMDACGACMGQATDAIKMHYKPTKKGINCDLCPQNVSNAEAYICKVTKVEVSFLAGSVVCKKCKQLACECGVEKLSVASLKTDPKYLEFNVCPTDYNRLKQTAAATRESIKGG